MRHARLCLSLGGSEAAACVSVLCQIDGRGQTRTMLTISGRRPEFGCQGSRAAGESVLTNRAFIVRRGESQSATGPRDPIRDVT